MRKKKILIFGCGAVGSSIAFLLTHYEIYLSGEFNNEKKFLENNFIEYRVYNYDKTFKINVKKFDFEKNFFIPDLIISTFKIGGIFVFNSFLKKIDEFLIKGKTKIETENKNKNNLKNKNRNTNREKILINILFLQNGTGWERYIKKDFNNIDINILRGLVFYNVTIEENIITQTSNGEIVLQDSCILKKIFNGNFNKLLNFDKKINNIIKVRFEKDIDRLIISKLIINFTNGIFTYLGVTFYDALKNIEVAKLLKDIFLFLILILNKNKIKFKRTKTLDPLEIIEFVEYFYEKKSLVIFFKFFIKYFFKKFKIFYLKENNTFNFNNIDRIIYENFLENIPKGYNSLYQTIYEYKKINNKINDNKTIDITKNISNKNKLYDFNKKLDNEFNFIVDFFIEKARNVKNIESFNPDFLSFIKSEINKLFEDKDYNSNLNFEDKLKLLKSHLYN